jgi:hypothetical protein
MIVAVKLAMNPHHRYSEGEKYQGQAPIIVVEHTDDLTKLEAEGWRLVAVDNGIAYLHKEKEEHVGAPRLRV